MMDLGQLALVTSFAIAMIATPGPANMLLFASGLNVGFRRTIPFLGGVLCGFLLVSLAAAAGLGGILLAVPELAVTLRAASVAYVLYLAIRIARSTPLSRSSDGNWGFRRGLIVHPLNPKAYAMTIGAYGTFAGAGPGYPGRAAIIFAILSVVGVVFNSVWVKAGDATERAVTSEYAIRWVNRGLAGVMVAVVTYAAIAM